jgi:hypothetical protein
LAVLAAAEVAAIALDRAYPPHYLWLALGLLCYLGILLTVPETLGRRRNRQVVASVNAAAILADTPPAPPRPLRVLAKPRGAEWLYWLAIPAAFAGAIQLQGSAHRPLGLVDTLVLWTLLVAAATGALLTQVPHWMRRRPRAAAVVLLMDEAGLELPRLGVRVAWQGVSTLRTRPHWHERTQPLGVIFVVADAAAVRADAQPPGPRAVRQLDLMLERDGGLSVPAHWLDQPLLTVLTTARDYLATSREAANAG